MIDRISKRSVVAGIAGLAIAGGGIAAAAPATAEETAEPKTRVTFMCKMPETGKALNAGGAKFNKGDYIFRIREEAGRAVSYTAGVGGAGLFTGSLVGYEVDYVATQSPVAGVSVKTDPGPNSYRGTASTNETQACDWVPAGPTTKDECKDGAWEAAGYRNQGECVSSFVANENAGKGAE